MKIRIAMLCAVVLPLAACAQETPKASPAVAAQAPVVAGDPRIALAAKIPGARPEDLRATNIWSFSKHCEKARRPFGHSRPESSLPTFAGRCSSLRRLSLGSWCEGGVDRSDELGDCL